MDLLGSILGSMDSTLPQPSAKMDEETKKKVQEAKAKQMKFKSMERKKKANFKIQMEVVVQKLLSTPDEHKKVFQPMDKLHRSIVLEIAETAGCVAHSFGEEEVDRHVVAWKKEHAPTEAELQALRNGEDYDPGRAAAEEIAKAESAALEERESRKRRIEGKCDGEQARYFEKYAKIVGETSGVDAALSTKSDTTYGMVPSRNKEDTRSIEETMNEIRQRKKQQSAISAAAPSESLSSSSLPSERVGEVKLDNGFHNVNVSNVD